MALRGPQLPAPQTPVLRPSPYPLLTVSTLESSKLLLLTPSSAFYLLSLSLHPLQTASPWEP